MDKVFNIGIIGPGHIACKMARTINKLDGFNNYAVASRSLSKAIKFKNKYKFDVAYDSYEKMLQDPNIDLVYIATPHSLHKEQMLLCLKHNKPVLCEKTFTTSYEDTYEVISKFEEKNLFISEALWTSYMPSRKIIEDILASDIIGNVKYMQANFKVPLMHKDRVIKRELGGGVLMDIGIYPVTFIFRTLGFNYKSIDINSVVYKNGVDTKEQLTFNYENGIYGVCNVDGTSIISLKVEIFAEKGKISIDMVNCPNVIKVYNEKGRKIKKYKCHPKYGGFEYELLSCRKAISNKDIECNEWTHENILSFAKVVDKIFNAIKNE